MAWSMVLASPLRAGGETDWPVAGGAGHRRTGPRIRAPRKKVPRATGRVRMPER